MRPNLVLLGILAVTPLAAATDCANFAGCALRNLVTGRQTPLSTTSVNSYSLSSTARNRFSIVCNVDYKSGESDFIKFFYNGTVHDEFGEPRWLDGDSNRGGYIVPVPYLATCGSKTVKVQGNVWSQVCFEKEYVLEARCGTTPTAPVVQPPAPRAPVKSPTRRPTRRPTGTPDASPMQKPTSKPTVKPVVPPVPMPARTPTAEPVTLKPTATPISAPTMPAVAPTAPPAPTPVAPVPTPVEPVILVVINADTDQDMGPLRATSEFVVGLVETPRINIRADATVPIGSVVFSSSNLAPRSNTFYAVANTAPYTAGGFRRNATYIDYRSMAYSNAGDRLTVSAIVYSGPNATGSVLYRLYGTIQLVGSTTDKTAPQLVSLKALSSTTIDLSKGPGKITYEISVQDDFAGVDSGLIDFEGSSNDRLGYRIELNPSIIGRPQTAKFTMEILETVPVGTYALKLSLSDRGWNTAFITAQDLVQRNWPGTIHIIKGSLSNSQDVTPPAFLGMKALGHTDIYNTTVHVPPTGPPVTLTFQITVQDDHSGFAQATLSAWGLGETTYIANAPVVGQPVTFSLHLTMAPESAKGPYWLVLRLQDGANNTWAMPSAELNGRHATGIIYVV